MEPQFVHFDDVRSFELAAGVTGRPLFGEGAMLNLIEFAPGATVPLHSHEHEQLGIVPVDAGGKLVGEGDVAEQARQVFRNMQLCLEAAGCGFDDVVKVVHYLLDVDDRPKINPVRMEFFGEARPASTLVEVSALAVPGALLEIEAVAAIPYAGFR